MYDLILALEDKHEPKHMVVSNNGRQTVAAACRRVAEVHVSTLGACDGH